MIKIGLIDVDSHNFPNLALMKLSAWHKAQGDEVEWWHGFTWYDRIYMSRVFDSTYTPDPLEPVNCNELVRAGQDGRRARTCRRKPSISIRTTACMGSLIPHMDF